MNTTPGSCKQGPSGSMEDVANLGFVMVQGIFYFQELKWQRLESFRHLYD